MGAKRGFESCIEVLQGMLPSERPQSMHDAVQVVQERVQAPLPRWRRKAPVLVDSRVIKLIEGNYDGLAEAFESMDINMDGKISLRELQAGLAVIEPGLEFTEQELMDVMSIADDDGSGGIDAGEFLCHFGPHEVTKREIRDGLSNMGRTADGTGNAYLTLSLPSQKIMGLEHVRAFQQVQFLDLGNNRLEDLRPLGSLPYLLELDVSANRLASVLAFNAPLRLRSANCAGNRIAAMNSVAPHRFLEHLDLSRNQIARIEGVERNRVLRSLVLDDNCILEIAGLGDLPLQRLSLRNNELTAIGGQAPPTPEEAELGALLLQPDDALVRTLAAVATDENGALDTAALAGAVHALAAEPAHAARRTPAEWERARCGVAAAARALDPAGSGRVDRRRFLAAVRRAGGRAGGRAGDPGAALLGKLRELDVSLNPLASLAGLERLAALRVLAAAGTGVASLDDLGALRTLPLLERVDLSGCPVCDPAPSLKDAGCFRLRAIQRLSPPQAQCKLTHLNGHVIAAEERVSSLNFFDERHAQYQDTRRDDAQDLPPQLFR